MRVMGLAGWSGGQVDLDRQVDPLFARKWPFRVDSQLPRFCSNPLLLRDWLQNRLGVCWTRSNRPSQSGRKSKAMPLIQ
jgi:hypothetical protein